MEVARSELATLIDAFLQDDQVALLRDLFNKNPESNELLKHDAHLATRVACLFLKERTMGLGSKSAERQSPSPDMTHLLRSGKNFPIVEQYLKKHVRPDASIEDLQPFLHAFRIQSVLAHAYPELEQWIGIDSKSTNPAHDFPARLQAMATSYSTLVVGSIGKLDALETLIRELISVSQSKDGDCNLALCKESQEFIQANTWSLWIDRVTVLIQAALSKHLPQPQQQPQAEPQPQPQSELGPEPDGSPEYEPENSPEQESQNEPDEANQDTSKRKHHALQTDPVHEHLQPEKKQRLVDEPASSAPFTTTTTTTTFPEPPAPSNQDAWIRSQKEAQVQREAQARCEAYAQSFATATGLPFHWAVHAAAEAAKAAKQHFALLQHQQQQQQPGGGGVVSGQETEKKDTENKKKERKKRRPKAEGQEKTKVKKKRDPTTHGKRTTRKWTPEETERLKLGVKEFGIGSWAAIHSKYKFPNRSQVDLKDKWRNLKNVGHIDEADYE